MTGEVEGYGDRSRLRISDADRHRVAELLREAAGEGRLDMQELDERIEATYAAKTYADLVPITADLPGDLSGHGLGLGHVHPPQPHPPLQRPTPRTPVVPYDHSVAIMGGVNRKGVWQVGATHTAVAVMGGVDIDLREARFSSREVVIRAFAFWGGVDVHVNAYTQVVVDGIGVMGAFEQARDKVEPELDQNSPVVRVTGLALMGGVTVRRRPMPGEPRKGILRR